MGAVRASGHIGSIEELGGAQAVAAARRAVADTDDAVRTVQICDLVDIALALGALQDLLYFVSGDVFGVLSGSDEELRDIADADAHVALNIADALATDPLGFAASAYHCTKSVVFVKPVGEMLHTDGGGRGVDGLFHRNDVHADSRASGRDELRGQFQGLLGSQVEHGGDFRIEVRERFVFDHVFSGSDDPLGHQILDVMVFVVAVLFQNTDPQQVVDDLLGFLHADVVALSELGGGQSHAALPETEQERNFALGQQPVQDPEIHVVLMHSARELSGDIVGDHPGQLHDHFPLDRVIAVMVFDRIISFIYMYSGIYLFGHCESSLS